MQPISINKFINNMDNNQSDVYKNDIKRSILAAAKRKKSGARCMICHQPIWAIGSGITGTDKCFTCITGEGDDSNDYELETVCY